MEEIIRKFNQSSEQYTLSVMEGSTDISLAMTDADSDESSVVFSQEELKQFITDAVAMLIVDNG